MEFANWRVEAMEVKRFTTFNVSGRKMESTSVVAIVGEPGRKFTEMVYLNGTGVTLRKIPNAEAERFCKEITQGKKGLARTARQLIKAGRNLGITKGAKRFLKAAIEFDKNEIAKLAEG
jgi:hypothetical protein